MAKRILAMILVLVLATPFFAVSEGNDPIFNELWNYIMFTDRLLEDEIFASMYFQKFYESRTQEDLLIAKAAIHSAYREVQKLEVPEFSMTEDECLRYMDEGVEIEALLLSYEKADTMKESSLLFFVNLIDSIEADVCFEPALVNLKEQLSHYERDTVYEARNLVYMVNYLLLQLKNEDEINAFWQAVKENTTIVKSHMDAFNTDIEAVISLGGENLDRLELNLDELNVLKEGFNDYLLDITIKAAETGDLSIFKQNRTEIIGETQVFPMPEWRLPSEMEYTYIFSEPGTDNLYIHAMGNKITSAPDRIKITIDGITIDEISDYIDSLSILEYNPIYEFKTNENEISLYVLAEKGGSELMIIWNEKETIVYLMPPAASLVPYMYWK